MKATQVIKFITNYIKTMETISKVTSTKEEILINLIQDFFDCRKLPQHLIFLEHWMKKVLTNRPHKKYLKASDFLFFSAKFSSLLAACYDLHRHLPENNLHFEEAIKIPESFMSTEQRSIAFYPYYLRKKEICDPILVFDSIFKSCSLDHFQYTLQQWVNEGLSTDSEPENVKLIFPIYTDLKRMIEACWLIHERSISKNSYQSLHTKMKTNDFSLSCPLLLNEEYLINPYLLVESFFSFASLNEYRADLTQWFKLAINEQHCHENASDLLFIHNQFIQLIHAGYLIANTHLTYEAMRPYTKQHDTFGHWLLARMDNQYTIQTLSPHFKAYPLEYCAAHLSLTQIIKLRYGLKEWLEAALSKNSSITSLDHSYLFDQFEELQCILEALFLLIIQPTLTD